jgi:hypothetical protein
MAYESGKGVEKDISLARNYYAKASSDLDCHLIYCKFLTRVKDYYAAVIELEKVGKRESVDVEKWLLAGHFLWEMFVADKDFASTLLRLLRAKHWTLIEFLFPSGFKPDLFHNDKTFVDILEATQKLPTPSIHHALLDAIPVLFSDPEVAWRYTKQLTLCKFGCGLALLRCFSLKPQCKDKPEWRHMRKFSSLEPHPSS